MRHFYAPHMFDDVIQAPKQRSLVLALAEECRSAKAIQSTTQPVSEYRRRSLDERSLQTLVVVVCARAVRRRLEEGSESA